MRETDAGGSTGFDSLEEPRASLRVRLGVGAAIVLVVAALVASVLITALTPVGATTVLGASMGVGESAVGASAPPGGSAPTGTAPDARVSAAPTAGSAPPGAVPVGDPASEAPASGASLMVHVVGAVAHPGVFALAPGSRVVDVVAAAGGFTDTAEQGSVNLARPLADGEQLRVLAVGETAPAGTLDGGAVSGAAGAVGAAGAAGTAGGAAGSGTAPALIDLNSATALDLDALPRIGPAMAERIVSWRAANGPFQSVDDLLQITGIGEKTLAAFRDLVTV